ncbi:conserved hypothetical protein [Frankia canadensis]|uniref:Uncharacterized protein n=1 Tax=Frankia canadensis TaxID=1836972 RepID=A0A2I2L0U9_9ACTN|nr:hypothetical protein [Frankia canadensis]SNQ51538.1 conserved hypothetical protein [Frankia canadensis]SOU58828.1 conserved hypothetical protein [Frankia canadensis]
MESHSGPVEITGRGDRPGVPAPSRRELLPARVVWTGLAEDQIVEGTLILYAVLVRWATGDPEIHGAWGTPAAAETHVARFSGLADAVVIPLHLVHLPAGT